MVLKTSELNSILRNHPHTNRFFLGTFPCDRIPRKPRPLTCFISNTDPHNKPGEHWVAFWVSRKGNTFYFDSFGLPPIVIKHVSFCQRSSDGRWDYNRQQLQSLSTTTCGAHCVRFLIETCRRMDPYVALSVIATTTAPIPLTDKTVVSYMNSNQWKWQGKWRGKWIQKAHRTWRQ